MPEINLPDRNHLVPCMIGDQAKTIKPSKVSRGIDSVALVLGIGSGSTGKRYSSSRSFLFFSSTSSS